jgi:pimeloyl-ACP methyl ester carboxylesterase
MKWSMSRIVRWLLIIIVVLVMGLYLVLPTVMGIAAIVPSAENVGQPPGGFESVILQTTDNLSLAAWFARPKNGAAIILIHGAGGSRETLRAYADFLVSNGFGVLAVDMRGHGQSEGDTNRLGWLGSRDVQAAVSFLEKQADVSQIGGLGISMGGEVLLGAASDFPSIRAIVADGATRRSLQELTTLPSEQPLVRNFTARVMYTAVQLFSGEQPPMPMLASMQAAKGTSFLLIAAGTNELEVAFNKYFADALGERAELWIVPEAPHTGAYALYPDEYEARVIEFFQSTLLGRP